FSLAPCSPPSRPLRAASGGGLRPVLTAAARGALPEGRSGRRDGSVRSNKGMLALNLSSASPPPMTDLLNFAHTTSSGARSDLKFGGSLTHAAAAADDARGASDRAGAGPPISGRRSWSEHARLHRPTITVILLTIEPQPI